MGDEGVLGAMKLKYPMSISEMPSKIHILASRKDVLPFVEAEISGSEMS
jgi:hypothetical protein